MPVWVVGISLIAPSIDANGSIGAAARSAEFGFWAGASIPVGLAGCMFILGRFFARPIWQMNLMTLPDFYGRRYDKRVEKLATLSMLVSGCILLAGNFAGLAILLGRIFSGDFLFMLTLVGSYVVIYSLTGGFITSLSTSIFQVSIFIIAILFSFSWLTWHHGWHELMNPVPETHKWTGGLINLKQGALSNWAAILSLALGNVVAMDLIQRIISSKSSEAAQKSCYVAGSLTLLVATPVSVIGLFSFYLNKSSDFTLLTAIATDDLPLWMGILLLIGVMAASIAVASGVILAMSNAMTRNLFQRSSNKMWNNAKLLRMSRLFTIPILIMSVTFAYFKPEPGTLLILAFDIVLAGCFAPMVFGIYWRKGNSLAALTAIVTGSLARLTMHFVTPLEWSGIDTLVPPLISVLFYIIVAIRSQNISPSKSHLISQPLTDEELITGRY